MQLARGDAAYYLVSTIEPGNDLVQEEVCHKQTLH
jgi:hypothetical protein